MNRTTNLVVRVCLTLWLSGAKTFAADATPMDPFDIIRVVSLCTFPRIEIKEPTTLAETLHFILSRYSDVQSSAEAPNRPLAFDIRLPAKTLDRQVSFSARDITMINALKLALRDLPVALTFEPGKLIISESPGASGAATRK